MEQTTGSVVSQVISVGTRTNERGVSESVTEFYPSYVRNVVKAFEVYPITKYFGLTFESAMKLPIDQWYRIRNSARVLYENQPPDQENQLLELLKELLIARSSGVE